jgi:hypothetical protein
MSSIVGILPLVHLKHFIFGNHLVSMPYFDSGGVLADDDEIEKELLSEAVKLGQKLKASIIELRQLEPLRWLESSKLVAHSSQSNAKDQQLSAMSNQLPSVAMSYQLPPMSCATKSHKVRMILSLPESSDLLMKSFKAKLRSQIKKPMKEGLTAKIGGSELLESFYAIFSANMRDLGSPVHSRGLMKALLEELPEDVRIAIVFKDDLPVAGGVMVLFRDTLVNPWSSSLKQYSKFSPNMLLYWTMLQQACERGCTFFDFGRSSPDEGTYRFKEQWGATPVPFHWQYFSLNGNSNGDVGTEKAKYGKAIQYWQKLPVPVANFVGPMIRKHISL